MDVSSSTLVLKCFPKHSFHYTINYGFVKEKALALCSQGLVCNPCVTLF